MPANAKDIELLLDSQLPLIVVESAEEQRLVELFLDIARHRNLPISRWSVSEGLRRLDKDMAAQRHNAKPQDVLGHLNSISVPGLYLLLDFHPYFSDPMIVRLLREIAQDHGRVARTLVLISPRLELPVELQHLAAQLEMQMPDIHRLKSLVSDEIRQWRERNPGDKFDIDQQAAKGLINNLQGLSLTDASRLARSAVFDDGAITAADNDTVTQAKHRLLAKGEAISFELDTARMGDVAGLISLKAWLNQRGSIFTALKPPANLDMPKGLLLLGVQGAGKSLAAKAVAGQWGVPLLRFDLGAVYNKYHGESERQLRDSLKTAEAMAPCVLWVDEIEKGIANDSSDGGLSKRILGTLLTWMAERKERVFVVATANDIEALPPELLRKGRFDEIFFVDLPDAEVRSAIFDIHLRKREQLPEEFDLPALSQASEQFSGAEIEQAVVAGLYSAYASKAELSTELLLEQIQATRPLAVTMSEHIASLRNWASSRTVRAN